MRDFFRKFENLFEKPLYAGVLYCKNLVHSTLEAAQRHQVSMGSTEFDPEAKERELRNESSAWDVSSPVPAEPGDIPVIDISAWIATGDDADLAAVAAQVNDACESAGFFTPGFEHPSWRLRMTRYPPVPEQPEVDADFGIAPHVDTTFFTLLLQNAAGLTIFSHARGCRIQAPVVPGAFE